MSRSSRIGVGIIETGWIAQKGHIEGFRSHDEAEIVAICSRTRESAEKAASIYGIPQVFTDYRALLASKDVDVVTIATPTHLHHSMTMDAIAAGKHIICEKPLASNYAQAVEMYTRAEAKGLKHMTGFTWRFTPLAMMMRELVQEGLLGKVFHVTACTLLGFRGYPAHFRTVITPVGGILAMAGSHLIDLTMSFVGPIGAVCGHAAQHITEPPLWVESHGQTRRAERDDSTIFLAKFRNAAQGVFHTSAVATGRPASGLICIEIHGDEGGLIHELELTPGGTSCVWASTIEEDGFTPVPLPDAVRSA